MNTELQKTIEENIRTKNSKLDLSYLKLTGKETELVLLKECTHLRELYLRSNQLRDISVLSGLVNLTTLDLSSNQLTDISVLSGLVNLTTLDLSYNQLTDISVLSGLVNLTSLYLRSNQLRDISVLSGLVNLTSLYLSSNPLRDISVLSGLVNLTSLDLGNNQLRDISVLSGLVNLTSLYLRSNPLTDISGLSGLENLTYLDLSSNELTNISVLSGLVNLTSLDLTENQLTDISALSSLQNLIFLNLGFNDLTDISTLSSLENLTSLNLSRNQLTDISVLSGLVNLTSLDLFGHNLTDISVLSGLVNLTSLDLSYNQLTDISFLSGLVNLTSLDLSENQLTDISLTFLKSLPQLQSLKLRYNPIKNIPQEIFNKYENVLIGVRNYLEDLQNGKAANREVKIIFIGNGSVGKTQVAKRLCEQENFRFDTEHQSTHAIALLRKELGGFQLNCWDFAGQDLYYATHRLFMQTRALFVLVWDYENEINDCHRWNGKEYPNEKLRYWLEYAKCFAPESPILVIQNKIDKPNQIDLYFEYRAELQKEYPIIEFLQVSAKTNAGFWDFEEDLATSLKENTTFQTPDLPISWVNVRDAIRDLQSNVEHKTLSVSEFKEICHEKDCLPSASTILDYLHDTGVLYYRNGYFSNQIIVNQGWAIEAIYKILDRTTEYFRKIKRKKGQLNYELIVQIWPNNTDEERHLFIEFMLSAELAFETSEKYTNLSNRNFVIPQLLPDNQSHQVAEWRKRNIEKFKQKIITYRFLPKVFIQRFIVKAHRFSNINLIWDSGIILETNKGSALIEAFYEKGKERIEIWYQDDVVLETIQQELDYISAEGHVKAKQGKPETNEEIFAGFEALVPIQNNDKTMKNTEKPKIYISYSWKEESDNIANQLQTQLEKCGIELIRDKVNGVDYMQSISRFMKKIGRGKYILVVIGNDYLESPNCMYELAKIAEHNNFDFEKIKERIFIVTLNGINIYSPTDKVAVTRYWEVYKRDLNLQIGEALTSGGDIKNYQPLLTDATLVNEILQLISNGIIAKIADLNTLSTQIHQKEGFKTLITRLNEKLKVDGYNIDISGVAFDSLLS